MKTLFTFSLVIISFTAIGQQKYTKWVVHFATDTQIVLLADTNDQINSRKVIVFKIGQDVCGDQLRFIAATEGTRDTFELYHIAGAKKQVAFFTDGKLNWMRP